MNALELSLDELYKGKATMIKDKKYFSTKNYVEPFIDRVDKMCQGNFIVKAQPASQISLSPDGSIDLEDTVFNRVWIQGILPTEYAYENHKQSINLLYALDTRKPLVKIFKNTLNMACLNMCVFSPEHLAVQELVPESAIDYSYTNAIMQMTDDTKIKLEQLAAMNYDRATIIDELGMWIDKCLTQKFISNFGTVKLPESLPIEAYKSLVYDEKSPYYTEEESLNGFTIYNAFTDLITNDKGKDIVNKFEKIMLVSQIMGI